MSVYSVFQHRRFNVYRHRAIWQRERFVNAPPRMPGILTDDQEWVYRLIEGERVRLKYVMRRAYEDNDSYMRRLAVE